MSEGCDRLTQVHHNHMVWISALTHLLSAAQQGRDTPHTTQAELLYGTICSRAAIWCCEERALHSTMQSTMNLNRLLRQGSQDSYIMEGSLRKKGHLWYRRSLRGHHDKPSQNGGTTPGTLPRGWKQVSEKPWKETGKDWTVLLCIISVMWPIKLHSVCYS